MLIWNPLEFYFYPIDYLESVKNSLVTIHGTSYKAAHFAVDSPKNTALISIEKPERLLAEGLNVTNSVNLIKSEIEKNPIKNRKKLFTNHILGYNYSGSRRLEKNLVIMDDVGEIVTSISQVFKPQPAVSKVVWKIFFWC